MKKFLQPLISIFLIISAVGLIFLWEFYLNDRLNMTSVVVAAKDIEKNQVIKNSDVKIIRIKSEQAVEKPFENPKDIIGLETSQYVAKGNQFVEAMLDRYGLEPNDNQLIYSIPKEWIYSSPGSLRRKDRVYIYAIYDTNRGISPNQPQRASGLPEERQTILTGAAGQNPGAVGQNPVAAGQNIGAAVENPAVSEPVLKNLVVAYAKDSSNQEVKPAVNSEKRLDATGAINNIELIMTQEQYSILENKYLQGYKFNFAYK